MRERHLSAIFHEVDNALKRLPGSTMKKVRRSEPCMKMGMER
jgi:hypothetical protein